MLRALTWVSEDQSPRLTPQEVESLFAFTYQVAEVGQLGEGKYAGASRPLFWLRVRGNN